MIKRFNFHVIVALLFLVSNLSILIAEEKNYKIIKLVNEQVITNYDLEQRLKLYAAMNNVSINDKNLDEFAREMLNFMVDEKLQIEQIKLYEISIKEDEVEDYISRAYLDNDQDIKGLAAALEKNNIDINLLKNSIKIKLGWNSLTNNLFYRESVVNKIDLENSMQENPALSKLQVRNNLIQKQIDLRAKKLLRDIRAEANIENR